jgi:hypothetical protein
LTLTRLGAESLQVEGTQQDDGPSGCPNVEANRCCRDHRPISLIGRFGSDKCDAGILADEMMLSTCTLVRSTFAARLLKDSIKQAVIQGAFSEIKHRA